MTNAIILAGGTLATCQQINMRASYTGGAVVLADGTLRRDMMGTVVKRSWTISWGGLTKADLDLVIAAYGSAVLGTVGFTSPDESGFTVSAPQNPALTWEAYTVAAGAGTIRYRASIELAEY